ncbi:tetraacyldisaccharide 4'-kinase [Flavicella sp.]|uniref:tetraacyldisaccharide 4'-kinase n=1 Tax=Flavicella sp. TaxID=2957742 RepID=UPI003019AA24
MIQKKFIKGLRWVLAPFSILYALVLSIRNVLFDNKILKQTSFEAPVIAVGNLSVGGTGKTPQIEYLIRLLQDNYTIAVLSRGYKRKSKGFVLAVKETTVEEIGDEPFQFHNKFDKISVAVDSDRTNGIKQLLENDPSINLILLDDAYQHRKVSAKFYILLTSYDQRYTQDFVLPLGNLRESRSGAKRANAIVVTKCPASLTLKERDNIVKEIKPLNHQRVFFSGIVYDDTIHSKTISLPLYKLNDYEIVLVTGIAKPKPLVEYLITNEIKFKHLGFPDHHDFKSSDISKINKIFGEIENPKKLILTTEKDSTRLSDSISGVFSLGIKTSIIETEKFNSFVKSGI